MNSERKSFAAFAATAALLLSSLPTLLVAAPTAHAAAALAISPTSGPTGTTVAVTGTGFTASKLVTTTFTPVTGPSATVAVTTDATGTFTTSVVVPAGAGLGTATITSTDEIVTPVTTTFQVVAPVLTPALTISPGGGAPGTTVTITGTNFAPSSTVAITFTPTSGASATASATTDGSGTFVASLVVPSNASAAPAAILATDAAGHSAGATFAVGATGIQLGTTGLATNVLTNTGVPQQTLVLTSTGVAAGASVGIQFGPSGGPFNAMGLVAGSLLADSTGTVHATVQVPSNAKPLTNTIQIVSGGAVVAATNLLVMTQTISYAGQTGPGGTFVSGVSGGSFSANRNISVTLALTGTTTPAVVTNTGVLQTDSVGRFTLPTGSLQVPTGQAAGVYQIVATDDSGLQATSASSSAQPFTVTALASTGNASLGLIVNNGVANACTLPNGVVTSIVGNAYTDSGAVATNVMTNSLLATTSGAYTNGETVNFNIGSTTVASAHAVGTTASATIALTTTQLAPGIYTVSALGTTSGTVATSVLYICPPTVAVSPSSVAVGTPITVTGGGFGAGTAVSGTTRLMTSTVPVTFGVGAPGVTQVFTTPTNAAGQYPGITTANGTYQAIFTPTTFGVYTLRATGVETTTTAHVTDLFTETVFTVTAGAIQTSPPVFPSQTFVVTAASGFVPGENVFLTPAGGIPVTTTANNSGGFVAQVVAPPDTPTGSLPVTVTSASRGNVPGGATQAITVPTASLVAVPAAVSVGGNTVLAGKGYIPNQGVELGIYFAGANGELIPAGSITATAAVTPDATGSFTTTFTVNPSVQVIGGNYVISGTSLASDENVASTPISVTSLSGGGGVSPSQPTTIYFAEGFTGRFATNGRADFDETISVLNPDNFAKVVTFTYQIQGSSTPVVTGTIVGPNSDVLRSVNADVGNDKIVSAIVSSNGRIAAERLINRTGPSGGLDGDSSLGLAAPGTTWYFAEGYAGISFQEYLTVQNPGATAANVTVTFLPASVPASTTRSISFTVPASSRWTENIRRDYLPYLAKSVGMIVTSDQPIVAERVQYWGDGAGSGKFGMATGAGMIATAKQFFFAYGSNPGATASNAGPGQQTNDESYVTVINPAPSPGSDATVLVSFFDAKGNALGSKSITVSPQTRETVVVNNVIAPVSGPFYTVVSSDQAIFVERPQYIGGSPNVGTHPGLSPSGSPAGIQSVVFPNLNTASASGTPISVAVFLLNPGATAITVNGTYYTPSGSTVSVAYTVAAGGLTVVNVNADAGNLPAGPVGAQYTTAVGGQFVAAVVANTATSYVGDQGVVNR